MSQYDDNADIGPQVKLIGRRHDVAPSIGVAIVESNNTAAIFNWALNSNAVLDLEISPVLDDWETQSAGCKAVSITSNTLLWLLMRHA